MDTLRISDADREAAVDLLSEQYAVGRLSKDEFDERSDAVWSAKTGGDLAPVFADLPVRSPSTPARTAGRPPGWRRGFPVPLGPVLFLLVALTVLTHMPFVIFGLLLWFGFARWHGHSANPWRSRR